LLCLLSGLLRLIRVFLRLLSGLLCLIRALLRLIRHIFSPFFRKAETLPFV
jgi:hypothetical protein